MDADDLKRRLEKADPGRVEFPQHVYERARKRNVDIQGVKQKVKEFDFSGVRPNNQGDGNFEYSFKATVEVEDIEYEMPIYFNVPADKLLVKSVWPR